MHPLDNHLLPIDGIRVGTVSAGIKYENRPDLVLFELSPKTQVSATFTQNAFCAAPVVVAKRHLAEHAPRFLLINTGYANAGLGELGIQDAICVCQSLAQQVNGMPSEVLPFSTGVIGEPLPVERIQAALPDIVNQLGEAGWDEAAKGIMTTDTRPKGASVACPIGDTVIRVTGIAKGAGMIKPNMATMLAFIATNAPIAKPLLDEMLSVCVEQSFNAITVDGDTSTNDACVLMATGSLAIEPITSSQDERFGPMLEALQEIFVTLAQSIVKDAEGATKFITVAVEQGQSVQECKQVAETIAHSPLVKTALYASDPNWGRILAAVGRSGVNALDISNVNIYLDPVCVVENGQRSPSYTEEQGQSVLAEPDIRIRIELGRGSASAQVWTCDLSHDYVSINADYRS